MSTIQKVIFAALLTLSVLGFSKPTASVSMDPPGTSWPPPSASI